MNNNKVIEAAKEIQEMCANGASQSDLIHYLELLQSQSELVGYWVKEPSTQDYYFSLDKPNSSLFEYLPLFTHPPLSVNEQNKADAERYRFLKPMYGMVNFDIYEAENEDDRQARIIFEKPKVLQKARTFTPATNESEK